MANRTLLYTWRWEMDAPPQRVWTLVSDTDAFNRATGVGPWTFTETPDPSGGAKREGSFRSLGRNITWDEYPFSWVEGKSFSVLRSFHNGPFFSVLTHLELGPSETGSSVTYSIEAVPRSTFWYTIARYYLGVHIRRQLHHVFDNVTRYLAGEVEAAYPEPPPRLSAGALARLRNAESPLAAAGFGHDLAGRLTRYIEGASDDGCRRIRPYALADAWGEHRETALRLCLHATRLGLLELTWDLMCPLCRGAKDRVSSLASLRAQAHCSSCNIQFDANFDRSVEVTFRPSQQVRQVPEESYCVGGPANTPHIVAQRSLAPGEYAEIPLELDEGAYRLRGPQIVASALLDVGPAYPSMQTLPFSLSQREITPQRAEVSPGSVQLDIQDQQRWSFC